MSANCGKRNRRSNSTAFRARLERSRQSARECRFRKKIRYQYLEELISTREEAINALRKELMMMKQWCITIDRGEIPAQVVAYLHKHRQRNEQPKSVGISTTDSTASIPAYEVRQNNSTTRTVRTGQLEESKVEQNVTSTSLEQHNVSSSVTESMRTSSTDMVLSDSDQCLEDLGYILQCYDDGVELC